MTPDPIFVKQYAKYQEAEAAARKLWDRKDQEMKKLVKLSHLGRKSSIIVPISENRGVQIVDSWRKAMRDKIQKIFTRAFNHRYELKDVPLENSD